MYNRVIMVGNLTKDPELRYTPQGTPIGNFRLAVSSKYRSGEEMKEETLFIDVVVWGKQGETCSQFLSKGRQVLVEGRLQERRWESDGQQKSKMEIVAQNVRFLGRKDDAPSPGQGRGGSKPPEEVTDVEPF
jgi:single-strand DNA-binding protein